MKHRLRLLLIIIMSALVVVIAYIFLHESGHSLVAALCGAENIHISIINAHSLWTGGSFSDRTRALCNAAGVIFPFSISYIGILLYTKENKSIVYQLIYFFMVVSVAGSGIAWIALPVYTIFVTLPNTSEDVFKFLDSSGISPIVVSLVSMVVVLGNLYFAKKKGLFDTYIQILKNIGKEEAGGAKLITNKTVIGLAAAMFIAVIFVVLLELRNC